MSTFLEPPTYVYIDPYEIQCWPPKEVEDAIAQAGIEYADLLEGVAALLVSRSPRFAQDLAPYLESYFHEHNFDRPLTPVENAGLRSMMANPETMVVEEFRRLVPLATAKATTLAVETFIQNRPGWVLKAVPQFSTIKQAVLAG
ncbi:MAG: hypothetical protein ACK46X_19855 [Candidatus Sericytochromatia bacterium]